VRSGPRCARCDRSSTTIVIEFAAVQVYLDLCEEHLAELLRGARPDPRRRPTPRAEELQIG
jgi:hypothetical protein